MIRSAHEWPSLSAETGPASFVLSTNLIHQFYWRMALMIARLILGLADRGVDAKKIDRTDFPDANPGDVVFVGFVGVARGNVFWQGGDHLFIASADFLFTGTGRCFYGMEFGLPVGTPVEVVWTGKVFQVNRLNVRAEYHFDLFGFLFHFHQDQDALFDRLGEPHTTTSSGTRVWRLAAAPEPWRKLHKLLLVETAPGCPDDKFQWEQAVAPQQMLVLEGALHQMVNPGDAPTVFSQGMWVSVMGNAVQYVRTDPLRRTLFLVFYSGPQYAVPAPS